MRDLQAKATLWRDRPPSGRFVLHRIRHDRHCPRHGEVTCYHMCKTTHPKTCVVADAT